MKVVVVGTYAYQGDPDGASIVAALHVEFERSGHRVEPYLFPFDPTHRDAIVQLAALALIDIPDADRLIAVGAPSSVVPHPNKAVWLVDQVPAPPGDGPLSVGSAVLSALREAAVIYAGTSAVLNWLRSAGLEGQTLNLPAPGTAWAKAAERLLA
jgi:hypothetical protein